ncbi:MAG: Gfo/Idh/MocA family oxidoreductase [Vicinamibacteraceae bacterium]
MLRAVFLLLLAVCLPSAALAQTPAPTTGPVSGAPAAATGPVRVAIAGLVHGHVGGFMRQLQGRGADMELVAVYEPDAALRQAFRERYKLAENQMFASLEDLLRRAKPEAVAAFSSTKDHRPIIEAAAAHGIHVMVEKPLAVSNADAQAIERAATKGRIQVVTNYETTWYPSHKAIWDLLKEQKAGGALRKIVVMDGHDGPKEINVQPEFLAWLRDPVQNGAGALFDFGCYGANLMTWLMDEQRPIAVTAVTQRFKPAIYPNVDDEATILIEYPGTQGIAQASWNWPFGRKDLEVYAEHAYAVATGGNNVRVRLPGAPETTGGLGSWPADERDAISYLAAVARGRLKPSGLSGLANNMIVVEILDAARESAKSGKRVVLGK